MSRTPARGAAARADPPADPDGDRFAAGLTAVVLVGVLPTSSESLLAAQAMVFAVGALVGLRYAPYHALHRGLRLVAGRRSRPGADPARLPVRRRLAPAPVRCAQGVGLLLAVLGTVGYLTGLDGLGAVATALLLLGASANASLGVSAGARLHPLLTRIVHRPSQPEPQQGAIA